MTTADITAALIDHNADPAFHTTPIRAGDIEYKRDGTFSGEKVLSANIRIDPVTLTFPPNKLAPELVELLLGTAEETHQGEPMTTIKSTVDGDVPTAEDVGRPFAEAFAQQGQSGHYEDNAKVAQAVPSAGLSSATGRIRNELSEVGFAVTELDVTCDGLTELHGSAIGEMVRAHVAKLRARLLQADWAVRLQDEANTEATALERNANTRHSASYTQVRQREATIRTIEDAARPMIDDLEARYRRSRTDLPQSVVDLKAAIWPPEETDES